MEQIHFRILGPTQLWIGDRFVADWAYGKSRALLAVLLLHPRRTIPFDELRRWIWTEGQEPQGPRAIYTYSARVRRALEQMTLPAQLVVSNGACRLEVDRQSVDYWQFRSLADEARSALREHDNERAAELAIAGLDLWTGRPLEDAHGEPAAYWRDAAEAEHLVVANDVLLQAFAAQGRFADMIHRLDDLPPVHQASLLMIRRRIEALVGQHRYSEATASYQTSRKRLRENGDYSEADELKRFYDDLVARSSAPDRPVHRPAAQPTELVPVRPHMLLHDISDFVGRDDLLERLDQLVTLASRGSRSRVIVLHGAAGVGKTTLAMHWAHRVAARFPDGRLYLDMHGFGRYQRVEPMAAVELLLAEFGVPMEQIPTSAGRASRLRNLLAGRRVLAIIDNVHISQQVEPLLDCLTTCTVVITSRRRLTQLYRRGAVDLTVPPLGYEIGKRWLAKRPGARADREPFEVGVLASLCGGIGLALRLVTDRIVARSNVSLHEFATELSNAQVFLGLGDDGDSPDGSLRATFTWSYHDLDPEEQRAFRLLGVHPGPDLSLDAAAALLGRHQQLVRRSLDILSAAHLVETPSSLNRYQLHDVLARYAYECAHAPVHADERTAAELRLLNFYLHTAHNADRAVVPNQPGIDPPPVLDGVVPISFSDDREAIGWCMRERVNLLHAIRLAAERRHHTYASLLPSVCGEILQRLGYLDDVTSALRIALDAAVALDDPEREAQVACNLGVVRLRARDPGAAESYLLAAKDLSERIGNEYVNAGAVNYLAQLYLERGELERGIRLHMHALDTLRRLGVEGPQVVVLCQLGEAHQRAGDLDAANSCCQNALWIADRLGDPRGRGMSLAELGAIFFQRGDPATARGYLVQALRPLEQVHDHGLTAKVCQALAVVSHAEHRFNDAEAEARQAVARFREARDVLGEAGVLDTLASVLQAQGRSAEAAAELRRALMIFDDHVDSRSAMIRARLADLDEHQPAESPDDAAEPTVRQVPSRRLPPLFRP